MLLARPVHYDLPDDLKFVGLSPAQGAKTARIRFSRGTGTTLDLPVSGELLSDLVRTLHPLFGQVPDEIHKELDDLLRHGLLPRAE